MKVIVAGSRTILDYIALCAAMEEARGVGIEATEVVSGGARGVDSLGERWAMERGIAVKVFAADWGRHGKSAGPIRNVEMAEYADALVALWDSSSRGTGHMISTAERLGLRVYWKRIAI